MSSARYATLGVLAALSLVPLAGCPEEGTGPTEPALILSSQGGTQLEADGSKQMVIQVRAFDGNQQPDNSAVSVTVEKGTLATQSGTVDDSGRSATLTPQEGKAEFSFQCPFREPGAVRINAGNANAQSSLTINCVEPRGTYVIRPITSACETSLSASGATSCPVNLYVELRTANSAYPEQGVSVTATVVNATPTDPADVADPQALSADGDPQSVSDRVVVITDEMGAASFHVHSTRLALEQTLEIELTAVAPDTTQITETITIDIPEFDNRSAVDIVPAGGANVPTGQSSTLQIVARDENGLPASGETVRVWVPAESGATLTYDGDGGQQTGTEVEVTLGSEGADQGTAEVQFNAPMTLDIIAVTVTAEYSPAPELPKTLDVQNISVYPEDALILNAVATPTRIRSDDNETTTITATLTRFSQGSVEPVIGKTVRFRVQASDVERIMFGGRPDPVPAGFVPVLDTTDITEAETLDNGQQAGVATAIVSAQTDRIRGSTTVEVTVEDGGETFTSIVVIQVDRDPILQSLIFVSATPAELGVRGSPYPSSSVVEFTVFDDLGEPIPNVPVRFDVNAASDPNASVVSDGFSDTSGKVSTVLSAGTQAGPISVVATATYDGRVLVGESLPIIVRGGLPSFGNSYVSIPKSDTIQTPPFIATITATLADRFTNRVPEGIVIHFRAEGGNIPTSAVTGDGDATVTFATGTPGPAPASLRSVGGDSWSYGLLVPSYEAELSPSATFDPTTCFDGWSATPCDVYALCDDVGDDTAHPNYAYCPLPRGATGTGCWETLEAGVLTGRVEDISTGLADALPAGTDLASVLALIQTNAGAVAYFAEAHPQHEAVKMLVDAYVASVHNCGPKTGCLLGQRGGLHFVEGDECPVAPGCMDFDVGTTCPQDGLLSVTASARGEEAFVDLNGNGIFDYTDVNGNERHDPGEPVTEAPGVSFHDIVVDMPEPYLDKNDNGAFDEYFGSPRLATYDEYRLTDLFGDEDGFGGFGYSDGTTTTLTNNQWDRDKQIFFSTHLIAIYGGRVRLGEPCSAVGQIITCAQDPTRTALCEETNSIEGGGIAPGCADPLFYLEPGDSLSMVFHVVDANGNCPSRAFSNEVDLDVAGPAKAFAPEVTLDEAYCGYGPQRDGLRPWVETLPSLSATVLGLQITADCEGADGPSLAKVTVGAGGVTPDVVSAYVNCPVQQGP